MHTEQNQTEAKFRQLCNTWLQTGIFPGKESYEFRTLEFDFAALKTPVEKLCAAELIMDAADTPDDLDFALTARLYYEALQDDHVQTAWPDTYDHFEDLAAEQGFDNLHTEEAVKSVIETIIATRHHYRQRAAEIKRQQQSQDT